MWHGSLAQPSHDIYWYTEAEQLGREHADVTMWLNNLAMLYHDTGRYAEAEPLYREALAITERTLGREHPEAAILLNNLAMLYHDTGRYAEAEPLYDAIAADENTLEQTYRVTLRRLQSFARLVATGRNDESL
jgi:tetratricopeptide (TPR) repeat protein